MSLSATRSRRSNAGNRWAEALAAAQQENGDAPDPDAEGSGEEFVGKEEEDVFASDFESTDEEDYAKQGVEDGEKQVLLEEKAERRAARSKASKSVAAPVQRMLDRAMKGEPLPKRRKVEPKQGGELGYKARRATGKVGWDVTRQSERALTVKHKALVQERLKDAAKKKAHAPKRPRQVAVPKTQDELIAAALELEEKNTKSLKEFLVKEEEKRAAARRVVRMKIDGPKLRWLSRGEHVRVKVVGQSGLIEGAGGVTKTLGSVVATPEGKLPQNTPPLPSRPLSAQPLHPLHPQPLGTSQSPISEVPMESHSPRPPTMQASTPGITAIRPTPSIIAERSNTPTLSRRSSTPSAGQRMQVYVELPASARRSPSSSTLASQTPTSQTLTVPAAQPLTKSPLSSSHPLPRSPLSTSQPLLPSPSQPVASVSSQSMSRSTSAPQPATTRQPISPTSTLQPPSLDALRNPDAVRQGSVSSTSSSKSRMLMYVELPTARKGSETPRSKSGDAGVGKNDVGGEDVGVGLVECRTALALSEPVASSEVLPKPAAPSRSIDSGLFLPGGPNFAVVLPTRKVTHKTEEHMRNYLVADFGGSRAPFGESMRAMFGDHANWEDVIINGAKPRVQAKPICAITGLEAPYRDPRTGIPYANAHAYKTLTRLLAHEFVWSREKGCYIGDEGRSPARGVPSNWARAAAGRF